MTLSDVLAILIVVATLVSAVIGLPRLTRAHQVLFIVSAVVILAATLWKSLIDGGQQAYIKELIERIAKQQDDLKSLFDEKFEQYKTSPEQRPPTPPPESTGDISITAPADGMRVKEVNLVKGTISSPVMEVRVIVHPVGSGAYWVQPGIVVNADRSWTTDAFFGMVGDEGKEFEIVAVADPTSPLAVGNILTEWPEARFRSQVVRVIRGPTP